jgi:HlyD family secretion protein
MSRPPSTVVAVVPRREVRAEADLPHPVVLEFMWPSTAIVNAPIPRSARGTTWIIASMVVALTVAMGVIPVDQVVSAPGVIVAQSPTILVQPLETAIVRSIDVHEGQLVHAGDLLAHLDPTFAAADLGAMSGQVATLKAEVGRLQAEAQGKPFTYSGNDPNMVLQASIFGHRHAEFESKVDDYNSRISGLNVEMARALSDAAGYRARLGVANNIVQMRQKLEELEVGSKLNSLTAADTHAEMQRAMINAQRTADSAKLQLAALKSERDAYVQGWKADVGQQLSQASQQLNDAREQLNKAGLRRQLVELRADRDAIVQSVAKVSVGSVLQSGEQLFTLVPTDAPLEVEANVSGRDSGFVHVGDPVAIKFDTFAFTQYGMAEGAVRIISPDSFTAQAEQRNPTGALMPLQTTEPFYRIRISIDKVKLHDVPTGFRVIPGMPITSDIKVGKRTILAYLMGRVVPIAHEAMREP